MDERETASYIQHLESEIANLQAEKKKLEAEISRLQKEKGLTREDLVFNDHTGVYADKAGRLYCPRCLNDGEKRNPLKKEKYGWRCTAGGHWFSDPDAPNPNANPGRGGGGGPNSWMAN